MRRMILQVDWLTKLWKGSRPMSFFMSAWVLRRRMFHLPAQPSPAVPRTHRAHKKTKRRSQPATSNQRRDSKSQTLSAQRCWFRFHGFHIHARLFRLISWPLWEAVRWSVRSARSTSVGTYLRAFQTFHLFSDGKLLGPQFADGAPQKQAHTF